MTRTFIEVPLFSKRWKEIGLGEDELQALQILLLKNPEYVILILQNMRLYI